MDSDLLFRITDRDHDPGGRQVRYPPDPDPAMVQWNDNIMHPVIFFPNSKLQTKQFLFYIFNAFRNMQLCFTF